MLVIDRWTDGMDQKREDTTSCLDKITWLVIIPSILECILNVYSVLAVDYIRALDLSPSLLPCNMSMNYHWSENWQGAAKMMTFGQVSLRGIVAVVDSCSMLELKRNIDQLLLIRRNSKISVRHNASYILTTAVTEFNFDIWHFILASFQAMF